jgi:hypothetical protein
MSVNIFEPKIIHVNEWCLSSIRTLTDRQLHYKQPKFKIFVVGLIFTDGTYWQELRRFTLRHLRYFGFGKSSMEGMIMEEGEYLVKEMKNKDIVQVMPS